MASKIEYLKLANSEKPKHNSTNSTDLYGVRYTVHMEVNGHRVEVSVCSTIFFVLQCLLLVALFILVDSVRANLNGIKHSM